MSKIAVATSATLLLLGMQGAARPEPLQPSLLALQSAAVRQGGALKVIVEFQEPSVSASASAFPTEAEASAATTAIRSIQLKIIADAKVRTKELPAVTLMDYVPMFSVEATPDELARIASNALVTRITEDRPEKPQLNDTVRIVGMSGVRGAFSRGADGRGRAIAVLDTGVDKSHEFLRGKVISEACFSSRSARPRRISLCPGGARTSIARGSGRDCPLFLTGCGHGTFVAGIAAGRNTGLGGSEPRNGVARAAGIVAIKVFTRVNRASECDDPAPCVVSYPSDQVKGLERVFALRGGVGNRKIDVANVSLGTGPVFKGFCDNDPRAAIIRKLRRAGIATVISSGNAGSTEGVAKPACISAAITVGASSKRTDSRAERVSLFSNEGPQVDLLAPGGQPGWPYGTSRDLVKSSIPGGYIGLSGTSLAAPHVSGAIAAIRSRPGCRSKSVSEIEQALISTGPLVIDTRTLSRPERRLSVVAALKALGCA